MINQNDPIHPRGFVCVAIAYVAVVLVERALGIKTPNLLIRWVAVFALGLLLGMFSRHVLGW